MSCEVHSEYAILVLPLLQRGKAAVDAGPGFINDDNGATSTTFFEQSHSSCAAEEGIRSSPSLRKSDNEGTTQESDNGALPGNLRGNQLPRPV